MGVTRFVVGSVAVSAFVCWLIIKLADSEKSVNEIDSLKQCFGEPLHSSYFTLDQTKNWIKARKNQLCLGEKALVMKINSETMKKIGYSLKFKNEIEKYLLLAIVSDNDVSDTLLVKYELLEPKLEELLAKGNGTLIVGG